MAVPVSFVRFDNERLVAGIPVAPINTWVAVNLESYLDDPSSIGVLLRARHTSISGVLELGIREVSSAVSDVSELYPAFYGETAASFGGSGTSVEFRNNSISAFQVFVIGEIHGPNTKLHDDIIDVTLPGGSWQEHTPTLLDGDVASDIAAVIHRVRHANTAGSDFGLRPNGSAETTLTVDGGQAYDWYVTGVDENGVYQSYTTAKLGVGNSRIYELGYVLKTGGVNVQDRIRTLILNEQFPDWGTIDFTGTVPEEAFIVGVRWIQDSIATRLACFLRSASASESGNMGHGSDSLFSQSVGLDSNLSARFVVEAGYDFKLGSLQVVWWEIPTVEIPDHSAFVLGLSEPDFLRANLSAGRKSVSAKFKDTHLLSASINTRPGPKIKSLEEKLLMSFNLEQPNV